jgi:hypothetical protein
MAVIINELEVVVEQPKQAAPGDGARAPAAARPPTPRDIADVLERQARYAARLLAH